jgi:hypothetical protein
MTAPHDAPTDPAIRRARTLGGVDMLTAAGAETLRGLLTSGGAAVVLYQLLTTQIAELRNDVNSVEAGMAIVAKDVAALKDDMATLRVDVVRLQVRQDAAATPPAR